MKLASLLFATALALGLATGVLAQTGDRDSLSSTNARVGDRLTLLLLVTAPHGASVDVVPGAPAWNGVEVVRTSSATTREDPGGTLHTISLVVAAFTTGPVEFQPVVAVSVGAQVTTRTLPKVSVNVTPVLAPNDPLKLTPLSPPESIGGGQSPLLLPGYVAGAGLAVALLTGALVWAAMAWRRRPRVSEELIDLPLPTLARAEQLMVHDPVAGYRSMANTVRFVLGKRYRIPAPALTTRELQRRMEAEGVDRWQARLAGGLLEECDAVVYAGYRPAPERQVADLNMARELVEPAAEEVGA